MYEKRRQQNTPSKEKRDEEEKSKHLNDDEVKKENDMKKKDGQKEEDLNENNTVKNEGCQNENDSPFDNIDGITLSNESFCVEFNDNWEKLENGNKKSQKSTDEDSLKNNISDGVVLSEKSNKKKKRKRKNNVKKEKKEKNERNKKTQTNKINKKNKKNKKENKRLLHRQTKDKFELLDCIDKTFEIRKTPKLNEGNVVDYYNVYNNFPISWDFLDYDNLVFDLPNADNDEVLTEEGLEAINVSSNHDWRRNNFYMNDFVFDTIYSVRYSVAITPTNDTTINK